MHHILCITGKIQRDVRYNLIVTLPTPVNTVELFFYLRIGKEDLRVELLACRMYWAMSRRDVGERADVARMRAIPSHAYENWAFECCDIAVIVKEYRSHWTSLGANFEKSNQDQDVRAMVVRFIQSLCLNIGGKKWSAAELRLVDNYLEPGRNTYRHIYNITYDACWLSTIIFQCAITSRNVSVPQACEYRHYRSNYFS